MSTLYRAKKTYGEKLLDPRWQKMRLEVFEMNDYTCQYCGNTEKTLHVHHISYHKNADPWDVDITSLLCLCCDCHEAFHLNNLTKLERYLLEEIQSRALMLAGEDISYNWFVRGVTDHILNTKRYG